MNTQAAALFEALAFSKAHDSWGELQDNRFAVIAGSLYELTSYNGCDDGHNYDVLTVQGGLEVYNPSYANDLADSYTNAPIEQGYAWCDDETGQARTLFTQLISTALASF